MPVPRDPGELDQEVTLMLPSQVQSTSGEVTLTYVDQPIVYAKYSPPSGRERETIANGQPLVFEIAVFTIRRRDDVTSSWRLKWNAEEYNIARSTPLNREWTEVVAVRGAP